MKFKNNILQIILNKINSSQNNMNKIQRKTKFNDCFEILKGITQKKKERKKKDYKYQIEDLLTTCSSQR